LVCQTSTPSPSTLKGFTGINNLTLEDSDALASVLPTAQPMNSQFAFYLFAADLFRNHHVQQEIHFSQLAIQLAPHGAETMQLWNAVVKGLTDLALYEDAYAGVMAMPFEKQFVVSFDSLIHTQRIRTGKRSAQATLPFACAKTTQSRGSCPLTLPESPARSKPHWLSRPAMRIHVSDLVTLEYYTLGTLEEGITVMVSIIKFFRIRFLLKLCSIVDNVPACTKATGHCHRCSILRVSCRRSVGSSIHRHQRFISSGRKGCVDINATDSRSGTNPCDDAH
jgi:hypothetical protein